MKELEFVTLENGNEYIILDEIDDNGIKYLYLVNSGNSSDFAIRKEFGNELIGLDNKAELNRVLDVFVKKNYELFNGDVDKIINNI